MKIYPTSFPEPLIDGYNLSVDMGVVRVDMETGRSKQRRRYADMPTLMKFSFAVPIVQLGSFQSWINSFGFSWFQINAVSYLTSGQGDCSPHVVRVISNLDIAPLDAKVMQVSFVVELAPIESFTSLPTPITDIWIVGGSPASPSNANLYWAGTPNAPAPLWVTAGSPIHPSAFI